MVTSAELCVPGLACSAAGSTFTTTVSGMFGHWSCVSSDWALDIRQPRNLISPPTNDLWLLTVSECLLNSSRPSFPHLVPGTYLVQSSFPHAGSENPPRACYWHWGMTTTIF